MFSQERAEELALALSVFGIEAQARVQQDGSYLIQISVDGKAYKLEWETQVAQVKIELSTMVIAFCRNDF